MTEQDGWNHPSTDAAGNAFVPSAEFHVDAADGARDVGLVFLGDGLTVGVGDPRGQGWVTRVVARSQDPAVAITPYNLGLRGDTSGGVLRRWQVEGASRWEGRAEKRLVVSVGTGDAVERTSLARHRLNLANVLDEASSRGIAPFVVGPPPPLQEPLRGQVATLSAAQADVCDRRDVPFVDTFTPLADHEQWHEDLATGDGLHPGQAGYGLMAWLVLHSGWHAWLGVSPA